MIHNTIIGVRQFNYNYMRATKRILFFLTYVFIYFLSCLQAKATKYFDSVIIFFFEKSSQIRYKKLRLFVFLFCASHIICLQMFVWLSVAVVGLCHSITMAVPHLARSLSKTRNTSYCFEGKY